MRGIRSANDPSTAEPNTAGTKLTTNASTASRALSVRRSTNDARATRAMWSPHSLVTCAMTRPRNSRFLSASR